jgi:hypothetical protein
MMRASPASTIKDGAERICEEINGNQTTNVLMDGKDRKQRLFEDRTRSDRSCFAQLAQ